MPTDFIINSCDEVFEGSAFHDRIHRIGAAQQNSEKVFSEVFVFDHFVTLFFPVIEIFHISIGVLMGEANFIRAANQSEERFFQKWCRWVQFSGLLLDCMGL